MATPSIPIEIWAAGDVILPNTHGENKIRPIDDLWLKGWDMGEKPACEEFNYVLHMMTSWIKYVTGDQIPELDTRFLRRSENLSDLADKETSRVNLDVWSRSEADNRYVNVTGDTMIGALSLPRLNFQPSETDTAYITTTNPASDWTYWDFVLGDNPGTAGTNGVDSIRFRFSPSGNSGMFTMMELNAISSSAALCKVTGNVVATGTVQGTNVNGTNATFTTTRTSSLTATGQIQGETVIATSSLTTPYARVNGEANVNSLVVNNNSARVAGRNIVRSVNGVGADGNGNVNIQTGGVQDVRLTGNTWYWPGSNLVSWNWQAPAGAVMTGIYPQETGKNSADNIGGVYYAYIQKQVNGVWHNVSRV